MTQINKWTPIASIIGIVVIEIYAINQGLNGTILAGTIAVVAAIGGAKVRLLKQFIKKA